MLQNYHIINWGIDKQKIFLEEGDYIRFYHYLYAFNDKEPMLNFSYYYKKGYIQDKLHGGPMKKPKIKNPLVNIYAFCLMPDHYQLLLSPIIDGNTSLFLKRVNGGYGKYFNSKYKRQGSLFANRHKTDVMKNEADFVNAHFFIHSNPLDLIYPAWRQGSIENIEGALVFLDSYCWSSHIDYIGKNNLLSAIKSDGLLDIFGGVKGYNNRFKDWLFNSKAKLI